MTPKLIEMALSARDKALCSQSKIAVGAALIVKNKKGDGVEIISGCNLELKIHKGIHAEVGALYVAINRGYRGKDFIAIAIVYPGKPGEPPYPACAECRQWLWELTNPDLLVITANQKGEILYQDTLKNLYPMPYPA